MRTRYSQSYRGLKTSQAYQTSTSIATDDQKQEYSADKYLPIRERPPEMHISKHMGEDYSWGTLM